MQAGEALRQAATRLQNEGVDSPRLDADLLLAGHTHGGQLCLPFYGAIVTSSSYGKRYESGLARKENTTMYISRGLGFEGGRMPRARFLCRPEIVSVDLKGPSPQAP